mmetsp:Transcript_27195/g.71583  ORF Transcript_27195/g.71583 Transcript_27195/m.71583 type:complete len:144 (-) Transcript_27195:99-530(-)
MSTRTTRSISKSSWLSCAAKHKIDDLHKASLVWAAQSLKHWRSTLANWPAFPTETGRLAEVHVAMKVKAEIVKKESSKRGVHRKKQQEIKVSFERLRRAVPKNWPKQFVPPPGCTPHAMNTSGRAWVLMRHSPPASPRYFNRH